jgi:phosphoserine aminotransferase
MTEKIYNFSAGPAILPTEVLQKAQSELLSFNGIGMSIMEISHRSRHFEPILQTSGKRHSRAFECSAKL